MSCWKLRICHSLFRFIHYSSTVREGGKKKLKSDISFCVPASVLPSEVIIKVLFRTCLHNGNIIYCWNASLMSCNKNVKLSRNPLQEKKKRIRCFQRLRERGEQRGRDDTLFRETPRWIQFGAAKGALPCPAPGRCLACLSLKTFKNFNSRGRLLFQAPLGSDRGWRPRLAGD